MTLILRTKSHGEIEAGFYAAFTKLARVGKYTFETKDLCGLATHLANNPKIKELKISGYNLNRFWEMEDKYINSLRELLKNTDEYFIDEAIDNFFKKHQGMSLEDKICLMNERITIPIRVNHDKGSLKIGEYEIENIDFGMMIYYLSHGGWLGWSENSQPEFAEQTISAIKKSKNYLYKKLQKRI